MYGLLSYEVAHSWEIIVSVSEEHVASILGVDHILFHNPP
jgi:hypothetical protein